MKSRVLQLDLASVQSGILNLWRKRMRDGITEHAEANWRIKVAPDLTPFFEVGDCVSLGSLHSLCLGDIENTPLAAERECAESGERTRLECLRSRLGFANLF